jgi:tetratricopeptide (TPR) repeat protein
MALGLMASAARAETLNDQFLRLYREGKYAEAEQTAKQALQQSERDNGPEAVQTATSLHNLSRVYNKRGNYAEAEPPCKRALAIFEKALGPDHPDTAASLGNLASIYSEQGKYAEAEPLRKRALAIHEKALGPDHPDTSASLNNLAVLYNDQGKYAEAEPLQKRALAIFEKVLGPDHPDTAASVYNLAILYETQHKYAEAEPLYKRAIGISEKALGPDHPHTVLYRENLARAAAAQRVAHAIELLKLGNGPLAKQELQVASRLDARSGRADFVMGLAYAFGGRDFSKAIRHFRETVSREPKNGRGWANLAVCAVLDKQYRDVATQFRSAFEQLPESQPLANNVALVIRETGAGRVKMSAKQLADLNDVYRQALAGGKLAPLDAQGAKALVLYGLHGGPVELTAQDGLATALAPQKPVDAGPQPNEPESDEMLLNRAGEVVELTPELARAFAKTDHDLSFPKVRTISDEVAEILSRSTRLGGGLSLDGLTELSDTAAKHLAFHGNPTHPFPRRLSLNGIKRLTPAAAAALGEYEGTVVLNGLEELPPEVAKGLAKHFKGELFLNSVTSITRDAAAAMANKQGTLRLDGLEKIDADVAAALGGNEVSNILRLNGLAELSADVARGLARHVGPLDLWRLEQMSETVSESLSGRNGALSLGITNLPATVAANLAKTKGLLFLSRISSLEPEVALALSKHEGGLVLGVSEISVEAARNLAAIEGELVFEALAEPSDAVIVALARHQGGLGLDKMKFLSLHAARALANHEGPLLVRGLERVEGPGVGYADEDNPAIVTLGQHRGPLFVPANWEQRYPAIAEQARRFPKK